MDQAKKHWGYILLGKGRPDADAQRQLLRAVGVDTGSAQHCHQDTLPPRPTRPLSAMPMRGFLAEHVQEGDTVHIVGILCLGVSPEDVHQFLSALLQAGATVAIHHEAIVLDPAKEMVEGEWPPERSEPVISSFRRARQAAYMRLTRAKKAKEKGQEGQSS